jgi:hypothetical protein
MSAPTQAFLAKALSLCPSSSKSARYAEKNGKGQKAYFGCPGREIVSSPSKQPFFGQASFSIDQGLDVGTMGNDGV